MVKGSFEGLYTFAEVGLIYGFDASNLRKQVATDKLVEGKDIKKFGKTWLITEQSMVKHFGKVKFEEYQKQKDKEKRKEQLKMEKVKTKSRKSSKSADSMNCDEEKVKDSWVSGDIKGIEVKNFAFNTNI
ncbi:MAG: helix-turn-helix domain-containing protein [Romboutsia sp.]